MDTTPIKLQPNPREKANFISKLLFLWTRKIFKIGCSKVLEIEDLFQPLRGDRSESLGNRLDINWRKQLNKIGRPSLLKAIARTFWKEYLILAIVFFVNDVVFRLVQPFLLGRFLLYFRPNTDITFNQALWYGGGIVCMNAAVAICINQFFIQSFHIGMKIRVAVCSIIYRKALRLSQTALGDTAPGKIVNLLSNDVSRFDMVSLFVNAMWIAPLMTIAIAYLLWIEARWAGMIGMIIVFIVVPIQTYTGKLSSKFRQQTALRTDERVRFMDEIISGVQVLKIYAWEKPFSNLIEAARRIELKIVRKSAYVRGLYMTFLLFTTRMALFCTMLSIVLLYGSENLTAAKVFVISAYFNIISQSLTQMFVRGVAEIAEAFVAIRRLQDFLEYEERDEQNITLSNEYMEKSNGNSTTKEKHLDISLNKNISTNIAVKMENVTARWVTSSKITQKDDVLLDDDWRHATLNQINLELKKGLLIGVVGEVGAGKSSFLQALLKELPVESGTISINGKVSYSSQEPWVFGGTIRQNILFGQPMEYEKYESVCQVCALKKDFEQFEHGDKTIIGERGAALSGGQKARVNLARAVYRNADIYLFDDPLSAVDAHVGKHLFAECIGPKGRLARLKATRILVTHQVHFLKEADWVVVLRDGKIEIQGAPSELSKSGIDVAKLLENEEEVLEPKKRHRTNSRVSIGSSRYSITEQEMFEDMDNVSDITEIEKAKSVEQLQNLESSSKGKVKGFLLGKYLNSGASIFVLLILLTLFILTQILASGADYWVSFWTSQEELRIYNNALNSSIFNETQYHLENESFNETENATEFEYATLKEGDSVINKYFGILSTELCISIHGSILAALFIIGLARAFGFYSVCVRVSQKLHNYMFNGLISTTMRFFDTNPSGRILNRFSKDMGAADELLPKSILDASQMILNILGAIVVTAIVNPLFLIPCGCLAVLFFFIRNIYLRTSKNIKRLEGVTRSPVFTQISATLGGLSTIRAFGAQPILIKEFDSHQDLHTATWYMFITSGNAFGLSLDLLSFVFVAAIISYFLFYGQDVLGDKVGLAITQVLVLTGMLQWGIRQSAEVANQLMSVERILEYRGLPGEREPEKPRVVEASWPSRGSIEFRNVVFRYFDGAEAVLKGLTFLVEGKEKIGIVGRTGAGKSSLIGSIFRLAIVEGNIFIDGIDTATVKLQDLRSKVSIIPQDPVLFSGTLRRNLDPFEEYPDSNIWQALAEVELKDIAAGPQGLQMAVMAGGSNFSVGQRQLLCLARALLRNNKILVLDEATANVDPHTDNLIQITIRQKFADCTVLTVAHRLHTIMDSDRVLVMDAGLAKEFDTPYKLLQINGGIFRGMVDALGPSESAHLAMVAKENYESHQKTL